MEQVSRKVSPTVRLTRAGIIAALYAALTYVFGPLAYGPLQIRPAEALCILPIFFPEAIPGLFVGCALANLLSGYGIYDIVFGSLITLAAAAITYAIGRMLKGNLLSALLGGIPPVLFNAIGIPFIIILVSPEESMSAYMLYFGQFMLTQSVWVYALGLPLYFGLKRLREKQVKYVM
ncbi:MAG: QueT transporter family protein [Clostridia bacterium]|nr:QueT transporter family protein [Clostridia bacterium]